MFIPFSSESKIVYVKKRTPQTNATGASWKESLDSIVRAIDVAGPGDEIWVAEGRYRQNEIVLKSGQTFRGGFTGNETQTAQRSWGENRSILENAGSQTPILLGVDDTVIDGFTFTGAKVCAAQCTGTSPKFLNCAFIKNEGTMGGGVMVNEKSNASFSNCLFAENQAQTGSGLFIANASPVIKNCTFSMNLTTDTEKLFGGGALSCAIGSAPMIEDCLFERNQGHCAGGVLSGVESGFPIFHYCLFRWNHSKTNGGAAALVGGTAIFQDCVFTFNSAEERGGALSSSEANSRIQSCTFVKNGCFKEHTVGGGLFVLGGRFELSDSLLQNNFSFLAGGAAFRKLEQGVIQRCIIRNNCSQKASGGLHIEESENVVVDRCDIYANFAHDIGGGILIGDHSRALLTRCQIHNNVLFKNNGAGAGAGVIKQSEAHFRNCTIRRNRCHEWYSAGGGVALVDQSTSTVGFCDFSHNFARMGSGIGARRSSSLYIQNCTLFGLSSRFTIGIDYIEDHSELKISNCLICNYDMISPILKSGEWNVFVFKDSETGTLADFHLADLGLRDPQAGDFTLQEGSPLIDAGAGTAPIGENVPFDGDGDGISQWDIGAHEYRPKTP